MTGTLILTAILVIIALLLATGIPAVAVVCLKANGWV